MAERSIVPKPAVGAPGGGIPQVSSDNYSTKLIKYIPGEAIAFYNLAVAWIGPDGATWGKITTVVVGLVLAVAYMLVWGQFIVKPDKRPRPWFYVLTAVAFIIWALGTGPAFFGLDRFLASFMLLIGIFVIPGLDWGLEAILPRKQAVAHAH